MIQNDELSNYLEKCKSAHIYVYTCMRAVTLHSIKDIIHLVWGSFVLFLVCILEVEVGCHVCLNLKTDKVLKRENFPMESFTYFV